MRLAHLFMAIPFVVLWPSLATCADQGARYATFGAGSRNCGDIIADIAAFDRANGRGATIDYASDLIWLAGFFSSANYLTPATYNLIEAGIPSVMLWVGNYCRANPLSTLSKGATSLLDSLMDERLRSLKAAKPAARPKK